MENEGQTAHFRWSGTFRALHQRNFRLFWVGQLIAITGTRLQVTALNWLIYQLTDSPLMLGLANFVALLPIGLLTPIGGVLSDYFPPRKLLLIASVTRVLQALTLAALALNDSIQVWHIMLIVFLGAAADTVELPTRYVFLTDLVAEEDYSNAVALNASAIHIGRIVGPAVAGLLIGWLDEASCFLFSSSCYVVFVAFLLSVRVHARTGPARTLRLTGDLIEGLKYVWYDKDIRALLTLLAAFSFLAQPYIVLMPVFARDVLHSDARGYGLLMSAPGVSAVVGALIVASMKAGHRGRYLIKGGIAFSVSLLVFSLSRWLPLSWVLLLLVGIGQVTLNVLARSLLQIIAAKEFRGRVASFFSLFYNGLTRLGGLEAGALSQYVSAPFAIQVGAVLSLAWVLLVAWRVPSVRRLP